MVRWVKLLPAMPVSHMDASFCPNYLFSIQLPANDLIKKKQQKMVQGLRPLGLMGKTQMRSSWFLASALAIVAIQRMNQQTQDLFGSVSPSL